MKPMQKEETAIIATQSLKEKEYWTEKLSGEFKTSNIPHDYPGSMHGQRKIETHSIQLPTELHTQLMKLSNNSDSRLHMLLTAGTGLLIDQYTGNQDIIIGTAIDRQENEGEFVNTVLPLRITLSDEMTFKELLLQIRETVYGAIEHQNYPLESILNIANLKISKNKFPLFDIAVLLENIHEKKYLQDIPVNLVFSFIRTGDIVGGSLEYNGSIYEKSTIEQLMDYLTRIFQVVLFDVNLRLGNIDILTEDEKDRLMRFFNNTTADYPRDKSIHALFSEQAERAPGHTALLEAHNHRSLSYKKLNEKVDQLAQLLISRGVRAESNIGLLLNRSIELIIGILGILKIGCTYVPIDTGSPVGRIRFMLTDSNAALLLTEKQAKGKLSSINMNGQIFLDDDRLYQECDAGSVKTPDNLTNPAYIIYTSGTTGTPKGVVIRQRALVNYAWWASRVYIKNEKINFPLYTSISFDLTVTSIYPPLLTGNTIIIYGTSTGEFLIEKILRENRVDAVKLTPSHLKLLRNRRELTENSRVRRFIVGGEKLETQLAQDIHLTFNGKVEIYNEYGPTEATVGCMIYRYDPGIDQRESVPIGAPVANARIYLLNSRQRFVPPGAIGEIYISGDGVAREYWNRRELTQEKFIPDPFMPGGNMYKTGDLARQLPAGSLEFLGRMDEQINIRGFRVELGEIEKHLANHEHIRDAVVITRDDGRGNRQICAYVVQEGTTAAEINAYLSQYLPDYMIPAYFVFLNSIPLTANGKLDKKALPDPIEHMQNSTPYQAPGNDIEKKLAVIWQQELGIEKIGINDNFFNIGGDSIKSITLLNAINKAFNTNLKLVNLYQNETIAKFAIILEQEKTNDDNTIYQNTMHEFENMKDEFLKGLKK